MSGPMQVNNQGTPLESESLIKAIEKKLLETSPGQCLQWCYRIDVELTQELIRGLELKNQLIISKIAELIYKRIVKKIETRRLSEKEAPSSTSPQSTSSTPTISSSTSLEDLYAQLLDHEI